MNTYRDQFKSYDEDLTDTIQYYKNQLPYTNMNMDIAYQILLKTEFDDLKMLCNTNQIFNKVCQSKMFWEDKYKYDKLINFGVMDRKTYEKVYKITKQTHKIFNLTKHYDQLNTLSINVYVEHLKKILPYLPFDIEYPNEAGYVDIDYNKNRIIFSYNDQDIKINKKEAIDIVIALTYFYPTRSIKIKLEHDQRI